MQVAYICNTLRHKLIIHLKSYDMKDSNSNLTNERSEVLQAAHKMTKKINPNTKRNFTFSEAQQKAWFGIRLKRRMRNEVLLITFVKASTGEKVQRKATLRKDLLPMRKTPVTPTSPRKKTSEKITYFELNEKRNCFKSFLPQNVICYEIVKAAKVAQIEPQRIAA